VDLIKANLGDFWVIFGLIWVFLGVFGLIWAVFGQICCGSQLFFCIFNLLIDMHANKSSNPFVICTHSVGLQTGARAPKTSTSKNLTRRMTALEQTLHRQSINHHHLSSWPRKRIRNQQASTNECL
jgi:hypothetical protein